MGTRKVTLALLAVLTLVFVSFPQIKVDTQAKTIVVPDDYATIQEAIDNANEGDIIFVKSGLYYQTAIINKSLSILGESRETTIIHGNGTTILFVETNNVTITGFTIRNALDTTEAGIFLMRVDYCIISENKFTDNRRGIDLLDSSYNIISGNIMDQNGAGLNIRGFNNNIYKNQIRNCNYGISISHGGNNTVSENNIVDSQNRGINLFDSRNNNFTLNNIVNSGEYGGIFFTNSHDNIFLHNNFVNNIEQIFDSHIVLGDLVLPSVNIWDNGSEGNYWSDYNGTDVDSNGIGDTPHIINNNNQDNYPLVNVIPEFPSWTILPIFLITTLIILGYRKSFRNHKLDNLNNS